MNTLFLLFFLLNSQSCIAFSSPINWIQNFFYDKNYQAVKAYRTEDYEESLVAFHELMNSDPYNSEYNYNVGDILYKQKKYNDAKQSFSRAIEHGAKASKLLEQSYFNFGNSCYQLEQWQDAVHAYEQILKMNEANESAYHNLQLALYKLKNEEMKDQQQEKDQKNNEKSQEKNKEKSQEKNDQCQNSSSDGDGEDEDQGDNGDSQQDKRKQQNKPGSQKNEQGQDKQDDGNGDEQEKDQGQQSKEKSQQQNQQQGKDKGADQEEGSESDRSEELGEDQANMNEEDKQESDGKQSSKNKLQDSGLEKEKDDAMQDYNKTQGMQEDLQQAGQEDKDTALDGDEKKEMTPVRKKTELKNDLQDQYESKASDDNRLNDYHASVMKTLENFEEEIQKHIIKNKVAMQGSEQNGKKGW